MVKLEQNLANLGIQIWDEDSTRSAFLREKINPTKMYVLDSSGLLSKELKLKVGKNHEAMCTMNHDREESMNSVDISWCCILSLV